VKGPSPLRLLVIADAHYAASPAAGAGGRPCPLGCELIRRAVEDARCRGGFDAVALMGDLLDDGSSPRAGDDLRDIREHVEAAGVDVPVLAVPGNHDGDGRRLLAALGCRPGLREIGGYRFFTFADAYGEGDNCARSEPDRRSLLAAARQDGPPIVALQHNPVHPPIESDYPYMHANRDEVLRDYRAAGVLVSVSGHYHPGQPLSAEGGVRYFTAPALCEPPFRYAVLTLRGRSVGVEVRALRLEPHRAVLDCHVHTEFAYCARDVTAEEAVARARTFGLGGICLVEHAPQLYCCQEDFWSGRHIREPARWRGGSSSRMAEFRAAMQPRRDAFVRVGLEVELDADGQLTLRDEDRAWIDLMVGSVHWLREDLEQLGDARLAEAFMRTTERLLRRGVDVLAHPWRLFPRAGRKVPKRLYGRLAELLAATGTAAEINFHDNRPDPDFFAGCIRRGVKLTFGSDAHELREVGAFACQHELLRRAAGGKDLTEVLFCPPRRRGESAGA